MKQVAFLGHIILKDDLSVDPAKIEAVVNYERLKNVSKVRCFLGLARYYRSFVQGFSTITAPLTKLTRKNVSYVWTYRCENNFQELKKRLTIALILTLSSGSDGYVVFIDASNVVLGYVLMQNDGVAAYGSR